MLVPDQTGEDQTMVDLGMQFTFLLADTYALLKGEFLNQTSALLALLGEPNFRVQGRVRRVLPRVRGADGRGELAILEVGLVLHGAEVAVAGEKLL